MVEATRAARSVSPQVLRTLKIEALVRHLGSVAKGLGVRFVVLKGAAIHALKLVAPNERPMGDLDVLLTPGDAVRLNDVLLAQGWKTTGVPRNGDHLPELLHSMWPPVELHDQLEGVTRDETSWAGFADLEEAGALEPLAGAGEAVLAPSRELLAAHAIAHGFFHHRAVAPFYPLERVFCDLRALGVLEMPDEEFLAGPGRWITAKMSREEILTIVGLARRLARGEDVRAGSSTPESKLLEHVVRSTEDGEYRGASRLANFRLLAGAGPAPVRTWLRNAATVLFLTRWQVDVLYGRPTHDWGYLLWRLYRPFDLVLRVARYSVAWVRIRARRGSLPDAWRAKAEAPGSTPPPD